MKGRNFLLIINPASGKDYPILAVFNRIARSYGIRYDVVVTSEERAIEEQCASLQLDVYVGIVVYGGDGTVHEVAELMVGYETPVYYLAGGTGNVLSKELGIDQDTEQALINLFSGKVVARNVDVGVCNKELFLLSAMAGSLPGSLAEVTREMKDRYGMLAYLSQLLMKAGDSIKMNYELWVDGEKSTGSAIGLLVLNMSFPTILDVRLHSQARLDSGDFVVMVIENLSLVELAHGLGQMIFSRTLDGAATYWRGSVIDVAFEQSWPLVIDDQAFEASQIKIRLHDKQLVVWSPVHEA